MVKRTLLFCALALALVPTPARAHLQLRSSQPARGDTVRQPLTEIRLSFTQAVEPRYTVVTLVDALGQEIPGAVLAPVGTGKTSEFVLRLARPLVGGAFIVRWKTAGADGHVVSGSFDFVMAVPGSIVPVTPPVTTAVEEHPPEHAEQHAPATEVPAMYDAASPPWVVVRWINFCALLVVAGAVTFRLFVLSRAHNDIRNPATVAAIDNAARRAGILSAALLVVSNGFRLWLQSGSLHGPARVFEPTLLATMLTDTGWGKAWLAQTVAAAAYLVVIRMKARNPVESWLSAFAFVVVMVSAPAFSGHAAAVEQLAIVSIVNDAVHVFSAAVWLGSLAVLLLAAMPVIVRVDTDRLETVAALVYAFSPVALVFATVLMLSGVLSALDHLGPFSDLWTTDYGRVLSIKLGLVVITATAGFYNWRVIKPRLRTAEGNSAIRRSAGAELIIASMIVLVTALLVALPTP